VDVRNRGVSGIQSDFSLRGSNFEQVLILIDGIQINDCQTGHFHGDIPINLEEIERVEIIFGGASALHGSGGVGGAINIITKKQIKPKIDAKFAHGQYNYNVGRFGLTSPSWHGNQLSLYGQYQSSDGYRPNTDFKTKLVNLSLNSKNLDLLMGYSHKKFGANSFYTAQYPWQWEHIQTQLFLGKAYFQRKNIYFKPTFLYRRHDDHYFLDRYNPHFYQNHHHSHLYNLKLPFNWQIANIEMLAGAEFSREDIKSNNLGNHLRFREAIFLSLNQDLGKLGSSLDLRLDNYSKNVGTNFSHNLSFSYNLRSDLKFRLTTGRSFRIPSFTELYYKSPAQWGNPHLGSEHAWHLESGMDIFRSKWQSKATIFYCWGKDIIDWMRVGEFWQAQNLTKLNTIGLTLNFTTWWHEHTFKLDYTYLNQTSATEVYAQYLGYLRHKANLILLSCWPYHTDSSLILSYQKRLGQSAYPLLDLKLKKMIQYSHGACFLFLEAKNLLGADYKDITDVPMPGTWVLAGVEIVWK
jgi:iron complex outermembrane receptor protein